MTHEDTTAKIQQARRAAESRGGDQPALGNGSRAAASSARKRS
jgi:hypothetical protein